MKRLINCIVLSSFVLSIAAPAFAESRWPTPSGFGADGKPQFPGNSVALPDRYTILPPGWGSTCAPLVGKEGILPPECVQLTLRGSDS